MCERQIERDDAEKSYRERERESTLQNKITIFASPLTVLKLFEEKKTFFRSKQIKFLKARPD